MLSNKWISDLNVMFLSDVIYPDFIVLCYPLYNESELCSFIIIININTNKSK